MSAHSSSTSDDAVMIDQDDVSNYNPEHILPESPEQIRKIRAWLKPTDYSLESGEFHKHLASHLHGTGTWLTSSEFYREWLGSENEGLLRIIGIPGSGKSVIAAHLVDELSRSNPGTPVLYFFFRQIIDANHEPVALLRDWLDQILVYSPPLQKRLKELIKMGRSISSISMEDQWSNLKLAFTGLTGKVFCIADALDEMDQGNDAFIRSLGALGQWKPNKVKVLITSRPVPTVDVHLRHYRWKTIRLVEKDVDADIASFVNYGLRSSKIGSDDQALIREAIPGRANGLFLYAKLALDTFLEPGACIKKVLEALPTDLHDMYTRLLREHSRRSGIPDEIQLLILQWVTHATRPLRLLEIAEMLNATYRSEPNQDLKAKKDLVRAATGPLLEILPDETVCVIHHSFTEYLKCITRSEDDGGYPVLRVGPTNARLTLACLSYLQSGCLDSVKLHESEEPPKHKRSGRWAVDNEDWGENASTKEEQQIRLKYPFYQYAAANWHAHAKRSGSVDFPQAEVNSAIDGFLSDDKKRRSWLKLQWPKGEHQGQSITPLHIAARFGLYDYAKLLITEKEADVHACDVAGKTPLRWAASFGHANIIRELIRAGAEPDVDDEINGLKPLHDAAGENHAEAVTALLEAGVDPLTEKTRENPGNWCGNAPRSTGHTALMYACKNGHLEALCAFLPFLQEIDTVHRALMWSAGSGRVKLVSRILQHPGIHVNAKVRDDTPLVEACRSSSRDTIVELLKAGADPTILCGNYGPEFGGIGSGRNLYFPAGAEEQTQKPKGHTALHALCRGRYGDINNKFSAEEWQELIALLIEKGADVNQQDHDGGTALHSAVNNPVVVRLLLDAGGDANAVNNSGQSPMHLVTSPDSISLLIELGNADINRISPRDRLSPILILLGGHQSEAMLKLLEYRPDLTLKDKNGSGPLHIRLQHWSADIAVIKALLDAGADPNERNRMGETPLLSMRIDRDNSTTVLDTLLAAGGDINAKDTTGMTLLARTMSQGRTISRDHKNVDALLERGADLGVLDFNGRTLLHHAISFYEARDSSFSFTNSPSTLDYLLTKDMDVKCVDYGGNTLLHELAMRQGILDTYHGPKYVSLGKQLLKMGINPNQRNHAGWTALHILTANTSDGNPDPSFPQSHYTILDLLISSSNDINQSDNKGLVPLHLASTISQFNVKKLLDAGADPSLASFEGLTPLHLAARARQSNIVGQLLEAAAIKKQTIVDAKDERGNTPLYYACMSGRPETVKLLLDSGASAADKKLFAACAAFESENNLWVTDFQAVNVRNSRKPSMRAFGLTLDDKTRSFCSNTPGPSLDTYKDTTRLNEILDMLVDHGADPSNIGLSNLGSAADAGFDYTVDCLARVKERFANTPSKSLSNMTCIFSEHAIKVYRDANIRAVMDFKLLREDESNYELVMHLLKHRRYDSMAVLFNKGVQFLDIHDSHGLYGYNMRVFVRSGLSLLVDQIGELEAKRQLEKGKWHAFNDTSKPGLYKKPDLQDNPQNNRSGDFLLYDAMSPLPNMDVVRLLVEKFHVDVNEMRYERTYNSDKGGYDLLSVGTVIHYLARGFHWWHVSLAIPYLVSHGASVNLQDGKGRSPLHIALGAGGGYVGTFNHEAAKLLVSLGANVNPVDADGLNCLSYASSEFEMVRFLVDHGAIVDSHALFAAVDQKQVPVLERLLSTGADPNTRKPLGCKSRDNYTRVSGHEEYLLWIAATRHSIRGAKEREARDTALKIIETLLAHGADPFATFESKSSTHISKQIDEDENNDAGFILAEEFSSNELETVTVLHDLLENGEPAHRILEMPGLDPNHRDSKGRTVLHAACLSQFGIHSPIDALLEETDKEYASSYPSFLEYLSEKGADILAVDNQGRNILHLLLAIHDRYRPSQNPIIAALRLLSDTQLSSLVNQPDTYGMTSLHLALRHAVTRYDDAPAEALLKAGADPFTVDNRGYTALHILAYRICESEPARKLFLKMLKLGLDINARDSRGETPVFNLNKILPGHILWRAPEKNEIVTPAEALSLFEDAGADLFARDNQGRGLLHVAATSTTKDSATRFELLVGRGLDAVMEDDQKRTALDVAAACDNQKVLKLFDKDNVRNKVTAADIEYDEFDDDDF